MNFTKTMDDYLNPLQVISPEEQGDKMLKLIVGYTLLTAGAKGLTNVYNKIKPLSVEEEKNKRKIKSYVQARNPSLEFPKTAGALSALADYIKMPGASVFKPIQDIAAITLGLTIGKKVMDGVWDKGRKTETEERIADLQKQYYDLYKQELTKNASGASTDEKWNSFEVGETADATQVAKQTLGIVAALALSAGFIGGKYVGDSNSKNRAKLKLITEIARRRAVVDDDPTLLNPSDFDGLITGTKGAVTKQKASPYDSVII